MIENVESNKGSLRKNIVARIVKLESYVHEDDTPATVKEVFKKELEYLRAELKRC